MRGSAVQSGGETSWQDDEVQCHENERGAVFLGPMRVGGCVEACRAYCEVAGIERDGVVEQTRGVLGVFLPGKNTYPDG